MVNQSTKSRRSHRVSNRSKSSPSDGIFYIDSMSSLQDYMKHNRAAIEGVFFSDSKSSKLFLEQLTPGQKWIVEKTKNFMPKEVPGNFAFAVKHSAKRFDEIFLESLPSSASSLILALDHIADPRNLGAIVRNCAFFGVTHVIVPQHRQVHLTNAAVATAMGGFASVQLTIAPSLARAIELLKEKFGFRIIGTAVDGISPDTAFEKSKRAVLVLGSEEKGISESVREICEDVVSIKCSNSPKVQSLNVSVCSGILIDSFFRCQNSRF